MDADNWHQYLQHRELGSDANAMLRHKALALNLPQSSGGVELTLALSEEARQEPETSRGLPRSLDVSSETS